MGIAAVVGDQEIKMRGLLAEAVFVLYPEIRERYVFTLKFDQICAILWMMRSLGANKAVTTIDMLKFNLLSLWVEKRLQSGNEHAHLHGITWG